MAGGYKRKSKSDDFVVDDDEDTSRPSKRGKAGGSDFQPSTEPKIDDEGNKYWEISKARRITVSEFKKNVMVNIREYYEADGKSLPGKKGISMTVDQYSALIAIMPQLESLLTQKGQSVPRPKYDEAVSTSNDEDEDKEDEPKKANIEATSDEEE